jgi:hypothetical protein
MFAEGRQETPTGDVTSGTDGSGHREAGVYAPCVGRALVQDAA